MKDLSLLVWLTQLGLGTAAPLAGFILLAVWLKNSLGWGNWVIWAGVLLGILCAISSLRFGLKAMAKQSKDKQDPPPVSFNDHK